MKAGDNKEFWQRTAKSYGQLPFRMAERVCLWEATDFSENMIAEAGKQPQWTAEGFERFLSEHSFQFRQTALLGGSLAPLCYLEVSVKR